MSSDESETEVPLAPPAKSMKKIPKRSPELVPDTNHTKKTTKMMIHEALTELKTRKGVSVYAIKKYITEKYNLDLDKTKYLIKKQIISGVADGTIVQMKGVGASGSFKLAPVKETKKKTKKSPSKTSTEKTQKSAEMSKKPSGKTKKISEKKNATELKKPPKMLKSMEKDKSTEKIVKPKSKVTENKLAKKKKINEGDKKMKEKKKPSEVSEKKLKPKVRIAKEGHTPAKKKAMMIKRKSIGSIIKPPKMKPKGLMIVN